ncbi:MAG TPA: alcohol dehydrogenase catalytic domain-containing protein, partial [Candidatus Saccharimonadales bacterium]|nr:alcohol dehydrogenase catalytic domain-containing protein [Candidatus Saccharimonadales bacterium]
MKAAYIQKAGPPENIIFGELDTPEPGDEQCLVKVSAVALNPIDTYIRSGLIKANLAPHYILGCDLAGTVHKTGPEVRRFKVGDRVWGTNQGLQGRQGTFAEFAAVDEKYLYPIPSGVRDEDAAAQSLVGITSYLGLVTHARIEAGETLFVNGG